MFTVLLYLIDTVVIFYLSDRWNSLIMYLCLFFSSFERLKRFGCVSLIAYAAIRLGSSGKPIAIMKIVRESKIKFREGNALSCSPIVTTGLYGVLLIITNVGHHNPD